jgi:hypothetical protein
LSKPSIESKKMPINLSAGRVNEGGAKSSKKIRSSREKKL